MRFRIIFILVLIPLQLFAVGDYDQKQIQERISPIGKVHVEESSQDEIKTAPVSSEAAVKKSPGQVTYEQYCTICHKDGVAGAPKFRDSLDWNPRIAKKNIDSLTESALKGLNAMPAKGTCQECSLADLKAAIEYMVPTK